MKRTLASLSLTLVAPFVLAQECNTGMRSFSHLKGDTCIPESPQRIVATRHDSLATPLIELGAPLVGVGVGYDAKTGEAFIRGATDILGVNVGEASGLTSIGNANSPDLEVISTLEPDLILMTAWQENLYEQMQLIAPTIIIPNQLPYLDHLAMVADAAGMSGTYDSLLAAYQNKVESIRATLGDPSAISLSYFDLWEEGVWHYVNWGARDQVTADIGFARPEIVRAQTTDGSTDYSFEFIPEFNADIVLSSTANRFGQTVDALSAEWDVYAPFWRNLPAAQENRHYWYPRDLWVGYTFTSLNHVAESLALLTIGRNFD